MVFRILKVTLLLLSFCSLSFAQTQDSYGGQMQKLLTTYRMLNTYYVEDVDNEELVEEAIIAMLKELDPHSVYITADDVKKMNEPLQGNFDGIGIQFNVLEDTLIVISPIPGGPSEEVGIRAGDRIVKVDTTVIAGVECNRNKMVELLRGEKGTKVKVFIKRRHVKELLSFVITRDKIPIYSLDASYMVTPTIGYIKLNRFAATTYDEFMKAFGELKKKGLKKLILDLQGNGGGYMSPSIKIADELLGNEKRIVYTEGKNSPMRDYKAERGGVFENGELVLLIDRASASASEIVSGAIQDWDRGTIIGRRSFGKGLVQRPLSLPDGALIRLTTARYYTPSGRCIQKPYEDGDRREYNKDLIDRYNNGELLNADSIHFPDSLRYETLVEGRTVYGGGGIMPDIFVPIDTTDYSQFHKKVVTQGILNSFMLSYIDENRASLKVDYGNFETFNDNFVVTDDLFQGLVDKAAEDSIVYDAEEFEVSHDFLFSQMKALVARDLFDMSEYYQIMNQRNEIFLKAVAVLEEE
jgi:carboxyl-terminal processing protease